MYKNLVKKPLLTIVIPTRNRTRYVKSAIESILEINDPRIELVIQDNSDIKELDTWINETISDGRLKYNYSNSPLSFVANFDKAISLTTGEYICLIGDDDGVNPEIVFVTEWMASLEIDSLSTKISANYVWENSGVPATKFTKVTGGVLSLSDFSFSIVESDLDKQLNLFFENGCNNYLKFGLPKLYQGIVRKKCLESVKLKTGYYFGGLSPDIFASISISLVANKVYVTDYPIIISGVCGESASIIEGLLKKNSKKVEDAPHLRNRGSYDWSALVPYVYTVETIWADSALAAIKAMGQEKFIEKFNVAKMAAYAVHYNRGIHKVVIKSLISSLSLLNKNLAIGLIEFSLKLALLQAVKTSSIVYRIYNRVLIIFNLKKIIRFEDKNNIQLASHALTRYLNNKDISFSKTNYKDIV